MEEQVINQQNDKVNNKKPLSKRKRRKLFLLILLMTITVALLIGGTYAWFVGLGKAEINAFDLEVTAGNQLKVSLTGETGSWGDSVTISEATINSAGYTGNTNHGVGEEGMLPVSTVGKIDTTNSRLEFYSKTSMSSTAGGYRILADKIDNTIATGEQDGYFVFDLFIKNGEDTDYIEEYNYEDDEDIYLTKATESQAVGAPTGTTDDYGIANSVRVALMQIGRVKAKGYTASTIQQITCADDSVNHITGLCNQGADASDTGQGKTWNIWEPNDNKHHNKAVERFNQICRKRLVVGDTLTYSTDACTELTATSIVDTYCINRDITAAMDLVDIYDGLNDYTSFDETHGLTLIDALTDSEVNVTDNSQRQQLFKLAANSITKVRVYIYIEGQDVDNYDMIYKGEKIKIKFGLTRDRYEMESLSASSSSSSEEEGGE